MRDPNDERKYKNFYERWDWLIAFMVVEDMFVHEVLMLMDKNREDSIKTMGVRVEGTRIFLDYNKNFVESLSDEELNFVITHEIYHLVFHHCTYRMPLDKKDHKIYNIAADLAINCLIPINSERVMPTNEKGKPICLLPKMYGFPEKLSMEQYVALIREKMNNDKDFKNLIEKMGEEQSIDNHDQWSDSEVIKEIVRNAVRRLSKNERVWGKVPGDLQALIMAAQQSYVSWERHLKHHLGNLISSTQIKTMKRPDRRFGYPYPGKKKGYVDRKLVAIDTSGSISDEDLAQFLAEVNRLAEINPVDLVLFDSRIQLGPIPFERKHVTFDFKGRGGTSFAEVFKLAEERHYHSVIMLTDGCASSVEYPHGVKDVLWVLVGGGNPPVEWGTQVHIVPKGHPQSIAQAT
jgi:predicted metal-dependent peptidase